jgi:hypothetical protein
MQKLDTEDLWIVRYHRSRFFTFLFFMHKLPENSLDKFWFAFFKIFYDFLQVLQESAKV